MEENSDNLGFYFKKINDTIVAHMNAQLKQMGLTFSQMEILAYLLDHQKDAVSPKMLEQHFHLRHSTVSGLLQRMEKKELISCAINPADRRSHTIILQDKAHAIGIKMRQERQEAEKSLAMHMGPEQMEQLKTLLRLFYESLFT